MAYIAEVGLITEYIWFNIWRTD